MAEGGEIEYEQEQGQLSDHSDHSNVSVSDPNGSFTEATKDQLSARMVGANYTYSDKTTALEGKLLTLENNKTNETFYNEIKREYKKWEGHKEKLLKCFSDYLGYNQKKKTHQQSTAGQK